MVGTSRSAPRAACAGEMRSTCTRSSPSRRKNACSRRRMSTYRSPDGPPRSPASPSPATRSCCPSSIPAGMSSGSSWSRRSRPSPRQRVQSASTVLPEPAQRATRLAPAELAAEERLEEIADAEVAETLAVAEHVVPLAPLGVGEHLVGLGDLFEALAPVGRLARVGMVLARELAVRAADLIRRRGARHAEKLVIVDARPSHHCHYPG